MKTVDDLVSAAAELADRGLSKGEIADELNVSRETANWLVERGGSPATKQTSHGTQDIHVDWSAIGRDSARLGAIGFAMADLLTRYGEGVDLVVGIEKAGAPLATVVAQELDADLATYAPRKHQWEEGDLDEDGGSFSRNFASLRGRECYVVDDTITSGTTMRETVAAIQDGGGTPVACCVLADKQGIESIDDVPVTALIEVLAVGGN